MDNRYVRISDVKQKIRYHPLIGSYILEEDIDLMERVFAKNTQFDSKTIETGIEINTKKLRKKLGD